VVAFFVAVVAAAAAVLCSTIQNGALELTDITYIYAAGLFYS